MFEKIDTYLKEKNGIENEVLIGKLCQIEQYASINPYFIGLV